MSQFARAAVIGAVVSLVTLPGHKKGQQQINTDWLPGVYQ